MITVEEAKKIIEAVIPTGEMILSPIGKCLARVIAKEVIVPFDFPLFTASAMDGYAIRCEDTSTATRENPTQLKVLSQIFAGDMPTGSLHLGDTMQIMTGAMIPSGATAVIPQEEVERNSSDTIQIFRPVNEGKNIRPQGEEIKQGEVAIKSSEIITPAVIGYLAALGIYEVPTFKDPRVAIVPTGSELIRVAQDLSPGKIFESNSYALEATLKQTSLVPTVFPPIADHKPQLQEAIQESLETNDFTIISGGVSVGEKDYIRDILTDLKVETLFWKVSQKPGKPLFFGRRENRFVFGLPGNPVSALVCYYEYVKPALLRWLGYPDIWASYERAILKKSIFKEKGRTHFLRAYAERKEDQLLVSPFSSQESHRMGSFAKANCLAIIPKETDQLERGDAIEIHWMNERGIA